jgi:ankyrin repeat protein
MESCFHRFVAALLFITTSTVTIAQSLPDAAMNQDIPAVRQLLSEGANPDAKGQFDTPAIHWLVRLDDIESTRLLLNAGADPNITSKYGVTPLGLAVQSGNPAMIDLLLQLGADANTREHSGETLLMSASEVGVLESVVLLADAGAEIDARDRHFDQTALMFATRAGHYEIASFLLDQGANPNARTAIGDTPNWTAPNSQRGFGFGIGIIRGGTPADRGRREPIPGGMTPLLYSARHDHVDIVEMLLDNGADIHLTDANNINALLMAVENNSMASARLFIERGSDINEVDWYGRTPLWEAINVRNLYTHNDLFENYINNREEILGLITLLVNKGADVNARNTESPPIRQNLLSITGTLEWVDFTGQTPFLRAARAGDMDVMQLLLANGADPHLQTFAGTNALMAAAGINWVFSQTWTESPEQLLAAVQLCIDLGMDVNHTNSMGLAAIHGAANRGSNDIINLLVQNDAKLDLLDNENRSPLVWANGVFLATHPAEAKPESMALITSLLEDRNMPIR